MGHTGRVDKLLLGHTVRQKGGWGRQVIIRTEAILVSRFDWVRPHPRCQTVRCL